MKKRLPHGYYMPAAMRGILYAAILLGMLVTRLVKTAVLGIAVDFGALSLAADLFMAVLAVEAAFWALGYFYGRAWARLERNHRELNRLQVLFSLSESLANESDKDAVCHRVVRHMRTALGYQHVRLYEVLQESGDEVLRAWTGRPPLPEQQRLVPGAGGYLPIPPDGAPQYTPDVTRRTRTYRWLERGSQVLLPLMVEGRCAALLLLARPQADAFSQDDMDLLDVVVNLLEATLERIRSAQARERRTAELLALQATMTDILAERELHSLLDAILQRSIDLLQADGGDLGLFQPESGETRVVAAFGLSRDYTGVCLQMGEGAMGWIAQHRQPLFVRDYTSWHNRSEQYDVPPGTQVLAAPLTTSGKFIGSISVVGTRFRESDLELMQLFAQQAALAVENARLYQSAVQSADKRRALYEASQDIVAALSPEKVCAAVHRAAARVMPAEAFTITLVNQQRQRFEPLYVVDRGQRFSPPPFPLTSGLSGRILERGAPIRVDNVYSFEQGDTIPVQHFGLPERVKSLLAVPVRMQGRVVGMLSAQSYQPYAYTEEDEQLLSTLANHAAIALENARLFARVREMAIRDELTGTFNRRYLFRRAAYELARSQRYGRPLGVIMLDVDHFKKINDTYGHAAGDQVLQSIVQLCQRHLRKADILGRYGGEEFVILLPETELEITRYVAERLRVQLEAQPIVTDVGQVAVTISVGVTGYLPSDETLKSLFRRADVALYQAKNSGRNRVCLVMTDDVYKP